jgi:hypothetical protein
MDERSEQRHRPGKKKLTWLDWILLLLAAAIMIWLVEYSMALLSNL